MIGAYLSVNSISSSSITSYLEIICSLSKASEAFKAYSIAVDGLKAELLFIGASLKPLLAWENDGKLELFSFKLLD